MQTQAAEIDAAIREYLERSAVMTTSSVTVAPGQGEGGPPWPLHCLRSAATKLRRTRWKVALAPAGFGKTALVLQALG